MSRARLSAPKEAPIAMPVFEEELRPGDGIAKAGTMSVKDGVVGEVAAGVKVSGELVG